ncbi:MAG TPA: type II secretion system protein [Burkholderiales bacterium]|nr:type II secretion system protein [Burkholderiales bacterium]
MSSGKHQAGFTYLGMLFLIGALSAGLAATAEVWSHSRQREKEAELLWVGNQFRQAIGLYYQRTPGAVKRYPEKLEDMLHDRRYATTQRYLRHIYADPVTGKSNWGLVEAPEGGIMGVHSLSETRPIKTSGFSGVQRGFGSARTYSGWKFVYEPAMAR